MRVLIGCLMVLGLFLATQNGTDAGGDKKEVTLKGTICCLKCELGKSDNCQTVIVVADKDKKEVIYQFDAKSDKEHHASICTEAKKGQVTGTVTDAKKKVIAVKTLKFE